MDTEQRGAFYTRKDGEKARYHYYRCQNAATHKELCPYRRSYKADMLEEKVWEVVSQALKRPEKLRAGLEEMIRQEEKSLSNNPRKQTEIWRTRIFEVNEKRKRYQEMAAEGLIDFDELREKLFELDEQKQLAEREIEALQEKEQRLDEMRRDKDELLDNLVAMTPRLLDELPSTEKLRVYEMLGLRVISGEDGTLEITGDLAGLSFGKSEPTYPSRS